MAERRLSKKRLHRMHQTLAGLSILGMMLAVISTVSLENYSASTVPVDTSDLVALVGDGEVSESHQQTYTYIVGSKIYFVKTDNNDGIVRLYVRDLTTGEVKMLVKLPEGTRAADLLVDPKEEFAFIADPEGNRVIVVQLSDQSIFLIGQAGFETLTPGRSATAIDHPVSLAFDAERRYLIVADRNNQRILFFPIPSCFLTGEICAAISVIGTDPYVPAGETHFTVMGTLEGIASIEFIAPHRLVVQHDDGSVTTYADIYQSYSTPLLGQSPSMVDSASSASVNDQPIHVPPPPATSAADSDRNYYFIGGPGGIQVYHIILPDKTKELIEILPIPPLPPGESLADISLSYDPTTFTLYVTVYTGTSTLIYTYNLNGPPADWSETAQPASGGTSGQGGEDELLSTPETPSEEDEEDHAFNSNCGIELPSDPHPLYPWQTYLQSTTALIPPGDGSPNYDGYFWETNELSDDFLTAITDDNVYVRAVPDHWLTWGELPYVEDVDPLVLGNDFESDDGQVLSIALHPFESHKVTTVGLEFQPNVLPHSAELKVEFYRMSELICTVTRNVEGFYGARLFAAAAEQGITHLRLYLGPEADTGGAFAQLRYGLDVLDPENPQDQELLAEGAGESSAQQSSSSTFSLWGYEDSSSSDDEFTNSSDSSMSISSTSSKSSKSSRSSSSRKSISSRSSSSKRSISSRQSSSRRSFSSRTSSSRRSMSSQSRTSESSRSGQADSSVRSIPAAAAAVLAKPSTSRLLQLRDILSYFEGEWPKTATSLANAEFYNAYPLPWNDDPYERGKDMPGWDDTRTPGLVFALKAGTLTLDIEGRVRPYAPMKRYEALAFVLRNMESEVPEPLPGEEWHSPYVSAAYDQDLIDEDFEERIAGDITLGEYFELLDRAFHLLGEEAEEEFPEAEYTTLLQGYFESRRLVPPELRGVRTAEVLERIQAADVMIRLRAMAPRDRFTETLVFEGDTLGKRIARFALPGLHSAGWYSILNMPGQVDGKTPLASAGFVKTRGGRIIAFMHSEHARTSPFARDPGAGALAESMDVGDELKVTDEGRTRTYVVTHRRLFEPWETAELRRAPEGTRLTLAMCDLTKRIGLATGQGIDKRIVFHFALKEEGVSPTKTPPKKPAKSTTGRAALEEESILEGAEEGSDEAALEESTEWEDGGILDEFLQEDALFELFETGDGSWEVPEGDDFFLEGEEELPGEGE